MNFELLIDTISKTHSHFQQQAVKAVNVSLTLRNWLIGYYIVEFEQKGEDRAKYGKKLLANLAKRCTSIKGLDERTFRNFRLFYLYYPQIEPLVASQIQNSPIRMSLTSELEKNENLDSQLRILGSLTSEFQLTEFQLKGSIIVQSLSYTHIEQLITIENNIKRSFYELECIKGTWSVRELKRQINSLYYERSGMSIKPEMLSQITQQKAEIANPSDIVKSVYAFEFLGLKAKDAVEENDLESALLDHLQDFMMEMGHGFCLEARQKKILIGDEYFFIDLVFYHRILKCHVLVELKVEDFNHHNIGQLNTYVNYYKANVMQSDDNPTVGILLVTNKNTALVEFATTGMDNKLFVSKYLLELPKKEILEAFITNELQKWNS
ncbi:PDDEXK nuclease domain-containing protein [Cognataquiflexum rubidum]|uniref:PDDEXK nuclease domain-containing protein n=1 Tax=Cognataquiflexum rubidum TaxID=2922273 RepID=UPI001F12CF50|nr:PDDEXK nuclease domain-containing protein [Cognataquiflexum rubidum]MCH6234702.1 PDDEXK nuclease domain-containing protein [Cognataquiflexum rubidum]